MDMTGEYRISAPRQRVWEALNDPETLKAAIPGCEELTKLSDNAMEAKVRAKVGPVSATFTGKVTLSELNPPISYKISGEGKGGAAGYAKGGADVSLAEDGADTVLSYNAKADVGGKLAQIGSRLIQGTARKMADDFFGKFSALVAERYAAEAPAAPPPIPPAPPSVEAAAAAAGMAAAATGTMPPVPAEAPPQPAPARQVAFQPERPPQVTTPKVPAPTAKAGQPWYVWLIGAIVLVIILFWLFR